MIILQKGFSLIFFLHHFLQTFYFRIASLARKSVNEKISLTNGVKVPIILYHRIIPDHYWKSIPETSRPEHFRKFGIGKGDNPYLYMRTKSQFEKEMSYLANNLYTPISLYQLRGYLLSENPASLPKKPIVITFDDGSADWFEIVFSILQRYNFKATFFLITNENFREKDLRDYALLTWKNIRQMANYKNQSGETLFDFESHTVTHMNLSNIVIKSLNDSLANNDHFNNRFMTVRHELEKPMETIEKKVGKRPRFLALPYGAGGKNYPPHTETFPIIKSIARQVGYFGIRTSRRDIPND